jgi:hypothetical protein
VPFHKAFYHSGLLSTMLLELAVCVIHPLPFVSFDLTIQKFGAFHNHPSGLGAQHMPALTPTRARRHLRTCARACTRTSPPSYRPCRCDWRCSLIEPVEQSGLAAEAGVDAEVYSSDAFISVLMFFRLPIYMPRLIAELSGMKNEKTRIIGSACSALHRHAFRKGCCFRN